MVESYRSTRQSSFCAITRDTNREKIVEVIATTLCLRTRVFDLPSAAMTWLRVVDKAQLDPAKMALSVSTLIDVSKSF